MNKNMKRFCIVLSVFIVLYNLLVFAIPFPNKKEAAFWLAYLGGMLALLAQGYVVHLAFNNKETLKSALYGWPVVRIGVLYLVGQMIASIAIFIIGSFVVVPYWIVLIIDAILNGFVVTGVVFTDTYREEIEKMEENAPLTTEFIYDLRVETQLLAEKYHSSLVGQKLYTLAEEVKFSDPTSSDSLVEIEDEINRKYIELKEMLFEHEYEKASNRIVELIDLIKERNLRCKIGKK